MREQGNKCFRAVWQHIARLGRTIAPAPRLQSWGLFTAKTDAERKAAKENWSTYWTPRLRRSPSADLFQEDPSSQYDVDDIRHRKIWGSRRWWIGGWKTKTPAAAETSDGGGNGRGGGSGNGDVGRVVSAGNAGDKKKVSPGVEPGILGSKPKVLTITLRNRRDV